ncbi:MAG: outer membrane lipoprotein chaperone LolA [Methylophilaceae bacterium]
MNKFLLNMLMLGALFTSAAFSNTVFAGGVESLKDFYNNTNAMRAKFHQEVKDNNGALVQQVEGAMQLQRPNKFRWDYNKPYEQQIISDGKDVFLYDTDLEQVTIRSLSQTLGTSPASLLAGGAEVEKSFTLKDVQGKDGLDWVEALPKGEDSGYERILLGFNGYDLRKMELYDSFKNTTSITFTSVERNPKLEVADFLFKTPEGVDVIGE